MAFETVHLFQQVELDIDTTGAMTLEFSTDLPGNAMTVRLSASVTSAPARRRAVNVRLPSTAQGKEFKLRLSGVHVARLYGARVFAKPIGVAAATGWQWYPVELAGTPELFREALLPIAPTEDNWRVEALAFPHSPALPHWVDLSPDAIE